MTKVGLIFIGAVRECLEDIEKNIKSLQDSCSEYDICTIFSTWYTQKNGPSLFGVTYIYDYNIEKLNLQIDKTCDYKFFYHQNTLDVYPKHKNGMPNIQTYHLMEIAKTIKEKNIHLDYIVKSRHDTHFKIKNLKKYLNDNFNVPPLYWIAGKYHDNTMKNDHVFITSFKTYMKHCDISLEDVNNITATSYNMEEAQCKIMKTMSDISYIDEDDIISYINRNESVCSRKFVDKN